MVSLCLPVPGVSKYHSPNTASAEPGCVRVAELQPRAALGRRRGAVGGVKTDEGACDNRGGVLKTHIERSKNIL